MDVKVNVNGMDAVVTVSGPVEAAALLKLLSGAAPPIATPAAEATDDDAELNSVAAEEPDSSTGFDHDAMQLALTRVRGTPVAKLLATLASVPNGLSDAKLRASGGFEDSRNFGPMLSSLSKACKKEGLPIEAVMEKKSRRGLKGKMHYHFKLTKAALKIILLTDDFEAQPDFSLFDADDE